MSSVRQLLSLAGTTPAPLGLKKFADLLGLKPDAVLARLAPAELLRLPGGRRGVARVAAARAARCGLRVCVPDMAPQASSTLALVGEPADAQPVFDGCQRLHAQTLEALRASQGKRVMQAVLRVSSQYAQALAAGLSVYAPPRQPVASADMDHCPRELLRLDA